MKDIAMTIKFGKKSFIDTFHQRLQERWWKRWLNYLVKRGITPVLGTPGSGKKYYGNADQLLIIQEKKQE